MSDDRLMTARAHVDERGRSPRHEGLRAGVMGGSVVVAWLLVNDAVSRPFIGTPALFGGWILSVVLPGEAVPHWAMLLAFALWHYAVWIGVAQLVLAVVHGAARTPSMLIIGLQGFILVQLAGIGITAGMSQGPLGTMAWRLVLLSNVLGWATTWIYIARHHPELRAEFAHADEDGETDL